MKIRSIQSIAPTRAINKSQERLAKLLAQMASGERIQSAADDPAGLAISGRMTSEMRALSQGVHNLNDGISYAQTAESALSGVTDAIGRMRELTLQAGNGTLNDEDRAIIQREIDGLSEQIGGLAEGTRFNGRRPLRGDNVQIAPGAGQEAITVPGFDARPDGLGADPDDPSSPTLDQLDVSTPEGVDAALGSLDRALGDVLAQRGRLGAVQNRMVATSDQLTSAHAHLAEARSRIADADYAQLSTEKAKQQILGQAGVSMLAQANVSAQVAATLLT